MEEKQDFCCCWEKNISAEPIKKICLRVGFEQEMGGMMQETEVAEETGSIGDLADETEQTGLADVADAAIDVPYVVEEKGDCHLADIMEVAEKDDAADSVEGTDVPDSVEMMEVVENEDVLDLAETSDAAEKVEWMWLN